MNGIVDFARDALGVEFYPGQRALLERCIASGRPKWVLALGRRSGKDLMAAVIAIHDAVVGDYSGMLRPGEERFIVVVATRQDQARQFIRVVRELLAHAPDSTLQSLVEDTGSVDEIRFRTGVTIVAMPCSSRATRGLAISTIILNEAAHMSSLEEGWNAGREVYRALLPSTKQFRGKAQIIVMSSPLWSAGIFWDLFRDGVSGKDKTIHVEQQPTWKMNPTITRESLESEFLADPDSARSEYGAEFAEGAGAFLNSVAIHECVVEGRSYLPPLSDVRYVAAADPAFAQGGDSFTFSIAHKVRDTVVIDRLLSWRGKHSPLNSDVVLDEIAEEVRRYGVRKVISDQYAVIPVADGLRRRGVYLEAQPLTNELKADIYTTLKRKLNQGEVELLDNAQLVAELTHLQVRPTPSGKPKISAGGGHHDDLAMVVATVTHQLAPRWTPLQAWTAFVHADMAKPDLPRSPAEMEDRTNRTLLRRMMRQAPRFNPPPPPVPSETGCRHEHGFDRVPGNRPTCRDCHAMYRLVPIAPRPTMTRDAQAARLRRTLLGGGP
jgi:hypothetical protein